MARTSQCLTNRQAHFSQTSRLNVPIPTNHYERLGLIPFEANPERIARAAEQRLAEARQLGSQGSELAEAIIAARECLLDPTARAAYDVGLRSAAVRPKRPEPIRPTQPSPSLPKPSPVQIESPPVITISTGDTRGPTKQSQLQRAVLIVGAVVVPGLITTVLLIAITGSSPSSVAVVEETRPAKDDQQLWNDQQPLNDPVRQPDLERQPDPPIPSPPIPSPSPAPRTAPPQLNWVRDGDAWVSHGGTIHGPLPLGAPPGPRYEVHLTVERLGGSGDLVIELFVDGHDVDMVVDGGEKFAAHGVRFGPDLLTRGEAVALPTGKLLTPGTRHAVLTRVEPGKVELFLNGKRVANWAGDASALPDVPNKAYRRGPKDTVYLSCGQAQFRVTDFKVVASESS